MDHESNHWITDWDIVKMHIEQSLWIEMTRRIMSIAAIGTAVQENHISKNVLSKMNLTELYVFYI